MLHTSRLRAHPRMQALRSALHTLGMQALRPAPHTLGMQALRPAPHTLGMQALRPAPHTLGMQALRPAPHTLGMQALRPAPAQGRGPWTPPGARRPPDPPNLMPPRCDCPLSWPCAVRAVWVPASIPFRACASASFAPLRVRVFRAPARPRLPRPFAFVSSAPLRVRVFRAPARPCLPRPCAFVSFARLRVFRAPKTGPAAHPSIRRARRPSGATIAAAR